MILNIKKVFNKNLQKYENKKNNLKTETSPALMLL